MVDVSREEYPFSSHFLDIDGVRLHYLDEGPKDGPVLLMVHGNPTWSFYFRHLVKAFSGSFRVIVPDHIGCGMSDKPQRYAYTLEQHICNLESLVKHLDLNDIGLVVHDWGGAIGMGMAVRNPQRMARFVVFNTAAFFVSKVPFRIRMCRYPLLGPLMVRGFNGFAKLALKFATSQPQKFTPAVKQGYLAPYDNWANRIAIQGFVNDIPLEDGHPTRQTVDDIDKGLAQFVDHPMVICWGAGDFCFTRKDFLPEWQRRFPQAACHVFEDAGHYVVDDATERIIPILKSFLGT